MSGPEEQAERADNVIRLKIMPISDFYNQRDPRHSSEAFELQQLLDRELPGELETRSAPGTKGVITDLIVPIATSGGMTALVEVFKAWLAKRPDHRKIDLEFEVNTSKGKRAGKLSVDASNVDSKDITAITKEAFGSKN